MSRIYNFSSGPAMLPLPVLEKARDEMVDYRNSGMSIIEMSHRDKIFDGLLKQTESNIVKLLGVPDTHMVLFMPGGASQQFAMIPLNFAMGKAPDFIHTGSWAEKAIKEAKVVGPVSVIWDGKDDNYMRAPKLSELKFNPAAPYAHLCSNETIGGVRFPEFPKTEAPLIADMSSDIMSREIDVARFGMIYAGLQKNLGPSGSALVILRKDLADRCPDTVNHFFRYKTHMKEPSLYNTPNTWAIYIVKLVTDWVLENGGVAVMRELNEKKAGLIYEVLDSSDFWKPCAHKDSRSIMNITWRMGSEELEKKFVAEARASGMDGLKGHRSVGGLRASIYNAFPLEGVLALTGFMRDFEERNG